MLRLNVYFQAFLGCIALMLTHSQTKFPIQFDNRPESGIPSEALDQIAPEKQMLVWSEVVGNNVELVRVRYYNPARWSSKEAVSVYLDGLCAEDAFRVQVWQKEVWAQNVKVPDLECLVDFTADEQMRILNQKQVPREGKLLVWGNAGCFRDAAGIWHFLTITTLSDAE